MGEMVVRSITGRAPKPNVLRKIKERNTSGKWIR